MSGSLIRVWPNSVICPVHIHKTVAAAAPLEAEWNQGRKARIISKFTCKGRKKKLDTNRNMRRRRGHGHLGRHDSTSGVAAMLSYSTRINAWQKKNRSDGRCRNSRPRTPPREMVCRFHWESTHPQKKCSAFPCNEPWSRPIMGVSRLTPIEPKPQPRGSRGCECCTHPRFLLIKALPWISFTRRRGGWGF